VPLCVLLHGDPLAPQQARLGAALAARGHRVVVCDAPAVAATFRGEHGASCEEIALLQRGPALLRRFWARRLVRRLGVDVIHLNYIHPRHLLGARMSGGPPYVATAWGSDLNDEAFPKTPEQERAVTEVLARAAALTADSVPLLAKARARAGGGAPAEIVLWGVDLDGFDPERVRARAVEWRRELDLDPGAKVVLSPRQTQPHYHVDRILRAFAASRWAREGGALVVKLHGKAPETPYRERIAAMARELGVERSVRYAPPCAYADLAGLYAAADVAVSAAEVDGVPSTFCELMALGIPIIAPDLAAYERVLEHGSRALLVRPGDDAALTAALDRLAESPPLCEALAAGGRAWAAEHADFRRSIDRFEALYAAAVGRA
jgi:glycosyltransferase involved in cell wall biosynthesis